MAGELVFITGATGFVGFATLLEALSTGYRVRISVRREPQIQNLSSHFLIAPYVSKKMVEFVVVPNIEVTGAFDDALEDVNYILHLASQIPAPTEDPERDIIQPAINGTLSILTSALKRTTVKRVVITSSVLALIPVIPPSDLSITSSTRVNPLPTGPYPGPSPAYRASKILALNATDNFAKERNPNFSIVNVMPGYVIGRNHLCTSAQDLRGGSNNVVLDIISGVVRGAERKQLACLVDVRDVAGVHVGALDGEKVVGEYTSFIAARSVRLTDTYELASKAFPGVEWFKEGRMEELHVSADVEETTKLFGELRGYQEMIESVVGQYVELTDKGGSE